MLEEAKWLRLGMKFHFGRLPIASQLVPAHLIKSPRTKLALIGLFLVGMRRFFLGHNFGTKNFSQI